MTPLRAAVVGGGPAGLYFAYLFKKSSPRSRVALYEQNPPDATYGFGVVLADRGLARLEQADRESHQAIVARIHPLQHQIIEHRGEAILVDHTGSSGAIGRLELLAVLHGLCEGVGVELHSASRVDATRQWTDMDLVVGADGINSVVRDADGLAFGTRVELLSNRFAWYGTHAEFAIPGLSFREHGGGYYVAHYYPYSADMGTFVAECDGATWQRAGLASMNDDARRELIERIFAEELQDRPLISNNSTWHSFPIIVNDRWHSGNRVLIGDALHSAHFSIGSGTRIAMDDAVALCKALDGSDTVPEALTRFEQERQPAKQKLLEAARASYTWFESFPAKMDAMEPVEFVHDYLARTGRMSDERLGAEHPGFMQRYEMDYLMWMGGCC